jgi:hypothetical protein
MLPVSVLPSTLLDHPRPSRPLIRLRLDTILSPEGVAEVTLALHRARLSGDCLDSTIDLVDAVPRLCGAR